LAGKVQDLVTPVWRRIGAGCHPNRRTVESIVAAGFQIVALQRKDMGFLPLIVGEARPVDPVGSR
jgi:hypothetical protein